MTKRKKQKSRRKEKGNKVIAAVLVFAAILLIAISLIPKDLTISALSVLPSTGESAVESAQITEGEAGGTQIIIEGGFPTGGAVQPQEGAGLQQSDKINVNNVSYGKVFSLDGSNVTNTTMSNYTFVGSKECGSGCVPSQGNCTLVNVSLIKISTGALIQNKTICTGQGYPVDSVSPDGSYFYNYFKTVLTTEAGESQSSYTVNVTAQNGTYEGKNSSIGADWVFINVWFTQGLSGVPPTWGNNQSIIPANYDPTNASNFTIQWVDNNVIDTVLFESNFSGTPQNYTMSNFTPTGYYSYINVLPAGTFYWKSYSNDTEPNWNVSDTWYFTISKSNQNIADLWLNDNLNQNLTITYPNQINATAVAPADPALYRNESYVGTNETVNLSAGYYEYKVNATGDANYSANATGATYYLTVNQATPTVAVNFTPSSSETYGTTTTASCTITTGDSGATLALLRNGTQVNTSTGSTFEENTLGAGVYNYTCVYQSSENYTDGASLDNYLTISQTGMPITLLLNGTDGNRTYVRDTFTNFTAFTSASGLTMDLYTNFSDGTDKLWDSGASPLINITNMTTTGTWNFTAYFAGNQNYTENSTTHYATVTKNPTNITIFFNGTEGDVSYQPGNYVNMTAVLNVSGKTIFMDLNMTNWTTLNGTTPLTNITYFGDEGVFNVTAWFPGDADYEPSSVTYYITIQAAPPAPPPAAGAPGAAAPAVPAAPPAAPTYKARMSQYSYDMGEQVAVEYEIKNPRRTSLTATVKTTIAKTGEVVWTDERDVTVSANTTQEWSVDVFQVICSTPFGHYNVDVVFRVNNTVVQSVPLSFNVVSRCKDATITVEADKLSYFTNDTAKITVTVKNTGNVDLDKAVIEGLLTGHNRSDEFSRTVDLALGETDTHVDEINLTDFGTNTYTYEGKITHKGDVLASASTTFLVVIPVVVEYLLPVLGGLGAALIVAWSARKPIIIKKKRILLPTKTRIKFRLVNRTKRVYKDVIIEDTIPALIPVKGVRPVPTKTRKMPDGSKKFEWHIKRMLPKEKKKFRYTLGKRKRWLPRAKVKKYTRDRPYERKLAKKELKKAKRGILRRLRGKPKKPAKHKAARKKKGRRKR